MFKVRYSYAPLQAGKSSREFCRKMVAAKKVYRKEDIEAMSKKKVNEGWGPKGNSDTYSIWFYKGGGSCKHYWTRKVYFRKRNEQGEFLPSSGLKNDRNSSVSEAKRKGVDIETNDKKVATRPRDMENRGFLEPKNFTTPK